VRNPTKRRPVQQSTRELQAEQLRKLTAELDAMGHAARGRVVNFEVENETVANGERAAKKWGVSIWFDHPYRSKFLATNKPLTPQLVEHLKEMKNDLQGFIDALLALPKAK
jgi:hypothetical protein